MITKTDIKYALEYSHDKGVEEGRAKGLEQASVEAARRMKADNLPVETICKYTGLTVGQVSEL